MVADHLTRDAAKTPNKKASCCGKRFLFYYQIVGTCPTNSLSPYFRASVVTIGRLALTTEARK